MGHTKRSFVRIEERNALKLLTTVVLFVMLFSAFLAATNFSTCLRHVLEVRMEKNVKSSLHHGF